MREFRLNDEQTASLLIALGAFSPFDWIHPRKKIVREFYKDLKAGKTRTISEELMPLIIREIKSVWNFKFSFMLWPIGFNFSASRPLYDRLVVAQNSWAREDELIIKGGRTSGS